MPPSDFIIFGAPAIEQDEIDEVVHCLESGWIGTGPRVARFEREFAAYKGHQFAAAVSSCTAAMHLSILAAGISEGDEVITTPLTFCATVNAIIHAGGTPVLADESERRGDNFVAFRNAGGERRFRLLQFLCHEKRHDW